MHKIGKGIPIGAWGVIRVRSRRCIRGRKSQCATVLMGWEGEISRMSREPEDLPSLKGF